MTRHLASLVSLSLWVVGCATAGSRGGAAEAPAAPGAATFFPLAAGTTWQYEAQMLGEKRTLPVTILEVRDGVAVDSTGARLQADAYGVRDQKRYLLRDPVVAGTRWTNIVSPSSVEAYEIIAVDQPCESPAGSFSGCVVVESRNRIDEQRALVNEMTLAPKVGIVRIATTLVDGGKRVPQSELKLLSFTPAR
ncbi:MAG: hypothetical protein MUC96_19005 [Myxococcaceae bacterium]|jgi:hypothetical protein|nr:hypothetical protein [Myxococcaceae bacterium]